MAGNERITRRLLSGRRCVFQETELVKASKKPDQANYGDQAVSRGRGGETHQTAEEGYALLTTQQGTPVGDDQNTLRQGRRGPSLVEDSHFREKIFQLCDPTHRLS